MLWIIIRIYIIVTDVESLQSFRSDNLDPSVWTIRSAIKKFYNNYIVNLDKNNITVIINKLENNTFRRLNTKKSFK